MTKSEFDEAFAAGKLCIRAENMKRWVKINDYARLQFGCGASPTYFSHDCARYPFVFCVDTIVDASMEQNGKPTISFTEFWAIVHEVETKVRNFHPSHWTESSDQFTKKGARR